MFEYNVYSKKVKSGILVPQYYIMTNELQLDTVPDHASRADILKRVVT